MKLRFYNILRISIIAVFCLLLSVPEAQAQIFGGKSKITGTKFKAPRKTKKPMPKNYTNAIKATGGIYLANYFGDLCTGGDCMRPSMAFSLGASYRLNESLMLRGDVSFIRLSADDEVGPYDYRNLSFRGDNVELKVDVVYDIFEHTRMFRRRTLVNPYAFLGIGGLYFNPRAFHEETNEWHSLAPLQTENVDYNRLTFVIPYGGGVRFNIHPHLELSFELAYRMTFTDYLDDVSTSYLTAEERQQRLAAGDELAVYFSDRRISEGLISEENAYRIPLEVRGDDSKNDGYFTFGVKASYTIKVTRQSYNINSNSSRFRIIKSIKRTRYK